MSHTLETRSRTRTGEPSVSRLAGKPASKEMLIDVARLEKEYFETKPDVSDPNQLVAFHTSGHRGSSLYGTFTEAHILAITQMIRDYRRAQGIDGPTSTNGLNNLLAFRFANTLVEAFWNRN